MKYKINDIVYSDLYKQYGWIWDIKASDLVKDNELCYVIKWFGRPTIDNTLWGQYNKCKDFDKREFIRLVNKEEHILYGPKTDF